MSPSPPPQTQLMCCVHNRKRTKRNLERAGGGKWRCTAQDPCLTGGERKGGAKGGGRGAPGASRGRGRSFSRSPRRRSSQRGRRVGSKRRRRRRRRSKRGSRGSRRRSSGSWSGSRSSSGSQSRRGRRSRSKGASRSRSLGGSRGSRSRSGSRRSRSSSRGRSRSPRRRGRTGSPQARDAYGASRPLPPPLATGAGAAMAGEPVGHGLPRASFGAAGSAGASAWHAGAGGGCGFARSGAASAVGAGRADGASGVWQEHKPQQRGAVGRSRSPKLQAGCQQRVVAAAPTTAATTAARRRDEGEEASRSAGGGAYCPRVAQHPRSPAALTVGSVAELSQDQRVEEIEDDDADGRHARNVGDDLDPTPSPSREVMCCAHGKFRLCRDLSRIPGTNDWMCNDRDRCVQQSRSASPYDAEREVAPGSPRGDGRRSSGSDDCRAGGSEANGDPGSARPKLLELRPLCPERSSRSRRATATGSKRAPKRPKDLAVSAPADDDDPLNLLGDKKELVRCTLHGKWRHPERMARKGNGDWVCTGDDRCKGVAVLEAAPRAAPLHGPLSGRAAGLKRPLTLRKAAGARLLRARAPSLQPPRITAAIAARPLAKKRIALVATTPPPLLPPPLEFPGPEAASGEDQSRRRARGVARNDSGGREDASGGKLSKTSAGSSACGGRSSKGKSKGIAGGEDNTMVFCALHGKQRHIDRLQKRRGQWICKPEDRCRNTDEVRCVTHGRWRSRQNMTENKDDGTFTCKPGCECH